MFYFKSPKIFPLFPDSWGTFSFLLDFQNEIMMRTLERNFSGKVSFNISFFASGKLVEKEDVDVEFYDGKTSVDAKVYTRAFDGLGYVEIGVTAVDPIFHNSHSGSGYGLFEKHDGDYVTVNNDTKFSHIRVVEQIRTWTQYSLVHTLIRVSEDRNIGNSFLFINPYKRPIVVRLAGENSATIRKKIEPFETCLVDLAKLVDDHNSSNVFLTASNRIVAYDVKHEFCRPENIFNIDHLDVYSGAKTWHDTISGNLHAHKRGILRRVAGRNF